MPTAEAVGDSAQSLVAGRMAVTVVDRLEMVDVGHHHGERRVAVAAQPGRAAEKGRAVEQAGQSVPRRHVDEFALHLDETLGGAQARVKLVGGKRQLQHVVGAAIQRLDELSRVQRPADQADVKGPLETFQQPRLPADFRSRRGVAGLHHDHGVDVLMGGGMDQRLLRVCEADDVMDALFQKRGQRPHQRGVGGDEDHMHRFRLLFPGGKCAGNRASHGALNLSANDEREVKFYTLRLRQAAAQGCGRTQSCGAERTRSSLRRDARWVFMTP